MTQPNLDMLTLGGGCYWCIEAVFQNIKGVQSVASGYSGGKTMHPTYEEVCSGTTGHAEVVQIKYDTNLCSLQELLKVFFTVHDPTTLNRQGADIGTQYRSVIFYNNEIQKKVALSIIEALNKAKVYPQPIVTSLEPFTKFYIAEEYHQNYYNNNKDKPYCQMVIQPKLDKFEKVFSHLIKKQ